MLSKRVYYSELWFCDEYYICGVNILAESKNRIFVKEIDLKLSGYDKNFAYRRIEKAKLYKFIIKNKKFKIAIAEIEVGIFFIAFLTGRDLRKSADVNDKDSRNRNRKLLFNFAVSHFVYEAENEKCVCFYSENKEKRVVIEKCGGEVKAYSQKFCLNPDAEIDFPDDLKANPYQCLGWYEDEGVVSFYEDFELAIKDARQYIIS